MKKFTQRQNAAIRRIIAKTPSVLPFAGDTPQSKAERIDKALDPTWEGFEYFCKTYFPHIFDLPFADAHKDMFEQVHKYNGIAALAGFRELGKTVEIGLVFPLWRIARGATFIVNTAATERLAKVRSHFMHHQFKSNGRFITDFPHLRPEDETIEEFFLQNNTLILANTISSAFRGLINPKTGERPDMVICDDIDLERNQGNQSIGQRKLKKILEEIGGCIKKAADSIVIFLGNLVHPNYAIVMFRETIIEHIRQDNPDFEPTHDAALMMPQRKLLAYPVEDSEGNSVWPEKYPTESLPELKERYGYSGYQREMLNMAIIDGNIFKNEWFQYWDKLPIRDAMKRVWLYCDPAWGEKGSYRAIIAIAYDGNRFYMLVCWVRQTDNSAMFEVLYDRTAELRRTYGVRFRPSMETTFGQHRVLDDFDRWARENGRNPISHLFKHINNKDPKHLRIEATETTIQSARLIFCRGQDTPTLKSQYLTYPDGHQDGPDAVAGALERFAEYSTRNRIRVRRTS